MKSKFMIHYIGAVYACELYDAKGSHCYDLKTAKEAALEQYSGITWEIYNGEEGYLHNGVEDYE